MELARTVRIHTASEQCVLVKAPASARDGSATLQLGLSADTDINPIPRCVLQHDADVFYLSRIFAIMNVWCVKQLNPNDWTSTESNKQCQHYNVKVFTASWHPGKTREGSVLTPGIGTSTGLISSKGNSLKESEAAMVEKQILQLYSNSIEDRTYFSFRNKPPRKFTVKHVLFCLLTF